MPDREGPVKITPEPIPPYFLCNGCKHLKAIPPANWGSDSHKIICKCRGMGKMPPIMWADFSRSIKVLTPTWCPLLPKGTEE